jgi:hypothetical protein
MLGHPKFGEGEVVTFIAGAKVKTGEILIVDSWGSFYDDTDVNYDIMVEKDNMLYKHINEKSIISVKNDNSVK